MTHAHQNPAPTPTPAPSPAWTDAELAGAHQRSDKPERVRRMFAAIATSYDLNNRLHSFGLDQRWRKHAVRAAMVRPGDHVLDVACGTGDLTRAFAETPAARVVGADFTPEMLRIAGQKRDLAPTPVASKIEYIEADAMDLPFPDASFDVVSIAFGIRNVADPDRALAQFARVLRPAGRLVVLEFDRPRNPLVRWGNHLYSAVIMPRTATLISRDRSGAYRYLPASVAQFRSRDEMIRGITRAGFSEVAATPLTFGICACYRATRTG